MTNVGYTLSSEEHGPNELVEYAGRAEAVGFDFLSISDHYHPWTSTQGEAPFVWGTLGGVAQATDDVHVEMGVTCPTMRIHPAVVAQAAATAVTMLEGRFGFGVGTGERLNEHVLGDHWPPHHVRLEMLEEAVEVMRTLWDGGLTSHEGKHYTVEGARLFTLPEEPPEVHVSAFGERTAEAAGRFGDGFWTTGPREELLEAYRSGGGEGPSYTQLHVCYAEDEETAVETAYEHWPNSALAGDLNTELPTPTQFEQAVEMVSKEDIAEGDILTDPDPEAHVKEVQKFFDAGYENLVVHQVGPDQEAFFEFYEDEVLPEVQ